MCVFVWLQDLRERRFGGASSSDSDEQVEVAVFAEEGHGIIESFESEGNK